MATFNIQKAKQMGYSDTEIATYLQGNPQLRIKMASLPTTTTATAGRGNLLTNLLPLVGSLAGTALGTPLGPAGMVGGGAIGSGAGEALRQLLVGEKANLGGIARESAIGGIGTGAGLALGKGVQALRGLGVLGRPAVEAGAKAGSKGVGEAIAQSTYKTAGVKALAKGGARGAVAKAEEAAGVISKLPGLTAKRKALSLTAERGNLNKLLESLTSGKALKAYPVSGQGLLTQVSDEAGRVVDLTTGIGKTNMTYWGKQIAKIKNLQDLASVNKGLLTAIEQAPKGQKDILRAIQAIVGNSLKTELPVVQPLFGRLSQLNAVEPVVTEAAKTQTRLPFGINLPAGLAQGTRELAGKGISRLGQAATLGGRVPSSQVVGQVGTRAFTGGTTGVPEGYAPPPTETETEYQAPEETSQLKQLLTPEKVALARLMLPDKQADAIEAAYKLLNPTGATSASDEFLSKASENITALQRGGVLGYGPVSGRLYELQISTMGGAGVPSEVVALNQRYNLLKLNILRAYQGARISDKDFELARLYIPSVSDTNETAKTKLTILNDILINAKPQTPYTGTEANVYQ